MNQYELVIVNIEPTIKSEVKKARPYVIISPNEMNKTLDTVMIVPIVSNKNNYPTRVKIIKGDIKGMIALDHIRTIKKERIVVALGKVSNKSIVLIKQILNEMLVE